MTAGAAIVSVAAGGLFALAIVRTVAAEGAGGVATTVFVALLAVSLAGPLAVRGPGRPDPLPARPFAVRPEGRGTADGPRVVLVSVDGASLGYAWRRVSQGALPTLGRLLDAGAVMDLATIRPTQAEPVWAAVATGKYPPKNGIRSAAQYRPAPGAPAVDLLPDRCYAFGLVRVGLLQSEPQTAGSFRARPLWEVLGEAGVPAGIVRWPVTSPAGPLAAGFLVTDRFHLVAESPIPGEVESAVSPPELAPVVREAARASEGGRGVVPRDAPASAPPHETPVAAVERLDALYGRVADAAARTVRVRLLAVRYQGLDTVGHTYLRYAEPGRFGDVTIEDERRYGAVLDEYYAFIDRELGRVLSELGPDDLLLVVSGFGMEAVSVGRRLLARALAEADLSGTHENAPDGFLIAYGAHVAAGRPARGSVVDIAPTVLYYLGLPVGRDMDGVARTELFTRVFRTAHPITFIPSYDR